MKPRFSASLHRSCLKMADLFASRRNSLKKHKLSDQTIKKKNYWTPVITKYLDLSVCLTDQLFAEAEGSPLTNHDILVNLVQK